MNNLEEPVITYATDGTKAVMWAWRKKQFKSSSPKVRTRLRSQGWYALKSDGDYVWLAWRCPLLETDGQRLFPADSKPCTAKEEEELNKAYKRRCGAF